MNKSHSKLAIIGLGYVGLPLAHAFSAKYEVVGFDIAQWRIDELNSGKDRTLELNEEQVNEALANGMKFTNVLDDISECNVYIVTVPTPIDEHKRPDLTPLMKASESIGSVLKKVFGTRNDREVRRIQPIVDKVNGLEAEMKVVVFSQYTTMLDIIEAYLKENGIVHAGLRGAMPLVKRLSNADIASILQWTP